MEKTSVINPYQGKLSTILLFGPPGVVKGNLGHFLASGGTQDHLSSGTIFRSLPPHSPAGKLYHDYASEGRLIPDEATIEIWKYYVQGLIATNTYNPEKQDLLLDGIPRTRQQAELLQSYIEVRHIIVLEVSNVKELIRRLYKQSREGGHVGHIDVHTLQSRLEQYTEQVKYVLEYYPKHLVSVVNAGQKPLEVLKDVLVRLSHLLSRGPSALSKMVDEDDLLYGGEAAG